MVRFRGGSSQNDYVDLILCLLNEERVWDLSYIGEDDQARQNILVEEAHIKIISNISYHNKRSSK